MTDVRKTAMRAVHLIAEEHGYSQLVLSSLLKESPDVSEQDRKLLTQIVYRTIAFLSSIDQVIQSYSRTPEKKLQADVREALRIGICQMLFMDGIPPYAAVSATVEALKKTRGKTFAGYANAVLRSVLRDAESGKLTVERKVAFPAWLETRLSAQYGREKVDELSRIFAEERPLSIRLDAEEDERAQILDDLASRTEIRQGKLCPDAYYLRDASRIYEWPAFLDGKISVQGESSMAASQALVSFIPGSGEGLSILDMCAAPGSKSCMIARRTKATVISRDLYPARVRLIEENKKRLRLENLRPEVRDALQTREEERELFDLILLDAPCSGIGTIRNKPDILLQRREEDLEDLTLLQEKMLQEAARMLKKGGVLVYSTCTLLAEENERQVDRFLMGYPSFEEMDLSGVFPGWTTPEVKHMTIWPEENGCDGFFIAAFRKSG
ncbi:MAG: 16S rRNA (cytosine(967)-C(5))-methyltransferase RsmB [Firmicutes bacterium]|nr:16S rRNA (cytosine(967)-C(5))-methyltransferase RsmB [Bacillota bacterium]